MSVTFHPSTTEPRSRPSKSNASQPNQQLSATPAPTIPAPPSPTLVPRLDSLTLSSIAAHLSTHPSLDRLPPHYLPSLLPLLSLHPPLDLRTAAIHIDTDAYWHHRTHTDFPPHPPIDVGQHGGRWKQAYCERWLQRRLEEWKGEEDEEEAGGGAGEAVQRLLSEIRVISPWLYTLHLTRFPSHADLSLLLRPSTRLTSLHARYGATQLRMDHQPHLLGMRMADAQALARLLLHSPSLTALSLPCNLLSPLLYPTLHLGLRSSTTLTHLDLSHNGLTDDSLTLLATLIPASLLTFLDLSDNAFTAVAMPHLAAALAERRGERVGGEGRGDVGCGLGLELRLGMNRLGWEGVEGVLKEVEQGKGEGVVVLNVVGCGVGVEGRAGVVRAVRGRGGKGVRELYVACNPLVGRVGRGGEEEKEGGGGEDGEDLVAAVQSNRSLLVLDVSMCGWSAAVLQEVQRLLDGRIEADKASKRKALEGRK